jgi:hypothetical protein
VGQDLSIESLVVKLRERLPVRLQESICLSPLPRWLAAWPQTPLAEFCWQLSELSPATYETNRLGKTGELGTTPWVVAYLPQTLVPGPGQHPATGAAGTGTPPMGTVTTFLPTGISTGTDTSLLPTVPTGTDTAFLLPTVPTGTDTAFLCGPRSKSLLLASSRVVAWSERYDLALAVRHLLAQQSSDTSCLVTGRGMTCQALSIHASHYFGLSCWEWIPADKLTWRAWFESILQVCYEGPSTVRHAHLFVTPCPDAFPRNVPPADWLAFRSANQVNVLSLRGDSHTANLVRQSIETNSRPGRVQVYLPPIQTNEPKPIAEYRAIAQQLMDGGAVGWHVTVPSGVSSGESFESENIKIRPNHSNNSHPSLENRERRESLASNPGREQVSYFEPGSAPDYLSHHTRGNPQQWPEEVEGDFWWRWLTEPQSVSWPWETLLRIACQQKLRAGRRLIPGQQPVVCFSARCPAETAARRTFRPHLRRWDYEPFGVAIQTEWLLRHGARLVEYLEAGAPVHHFQQIRYSKGSTATRVDWSLEQEYRVEGDLDLRTVPVDAMFYFVRTSSEAHRLAGYTPCQVKFLERCE